MGQMLASVGNERKGLFIDGITKKIRFQLFGHMDKWVGVVELSQWWGSCLSRVVV